MEYKVVSSERDLDISLLYFFKKAVYSASDYSKIKYYFNELVNELNFLDDSVFCAYKIPGADIQQDFYHVKYNISSNSSDRMTEIRISFLCLRDKPIHFVIENENKAGSIIDDLHSFKVHPVVLKGLTKIPRFLLLPGYQTN